MPKLLIEARYPDGEVSKEGEHEVENMSAATQALADDLFRTADEVWGNQVLNAWNAHPGECSKMDDDVEWTFRYVED